MPVKSPLILAFSRPRAPQGFPAFRQMVNRIFSAVAGVPAYILPHLYDLTPGGPVLQTLKGIDSDMLLLAPLFPRAAQLVLQANGLRYRLVGNRVEGDGEAPRPRKTRRLWAFDYREYRTLDGLTQAVLAVVAEIAARQLPDLPTTTDQLESRIYELEEVTRARWYPVIDEERCTSCYECLNFCLFGVYDVQEDGRVFTAQPDACRPGCPACARVCPPGAIVFPLYPDSTIAGGDGDSPAKVSAAGDGGTSHSPSLREEAEKWRAQFMSPSPETGAKPPGTDQPGPLEDPGGRTQGRLSGEVSSPPPSGGASAHPEITPELIEDWLDEAEGGSKLPEGR